MIHENFEPKTGKFGYFGKGHIESNEFRRLCVAYWCVRPRLVQHVWMKPTRSRKKKRRRYFFLEKITRCKKTDPEAEPFTFGRI